MALTFDLCEQPHEVSGYQGRLVEVLREQAVRSTFFAGGKWLLTHPARAEQLIADPLFEIANHAWEHRNLRLLSGSALDEEIWNPQLAFKKVRGELARRQCVPATVAPGMTLFRFPFGACDAKSLAAVEAAGLRAIQWDVSSSDPWRGQTPDKMVRDVVSKVRPGSIVLFHANGRGWHTDQALPAIISQLRADGYKFATVSEMLAVPGARPVVSDSCYDSKPGDTDRYDTLARALADQHLREVERLRSIGTGFQSTAPIAPRTGQPRQPFERAPPPPPQRP